MPDLESVAQQEKLLAAYRETLIHYLVQRARLGSDYSPPGITHGIREARAEISRIKTILSGWGIAVEDLPDDVEDTLLGAQISRRDFPKKVIISASKKEGGDVLDFTYIYLTNEANINEDIINLSNIHGKLKITWEMSFSSQPSIQEINVNWQTWRSKEEKSVRLYKGISREQILRFEIDLIAEGNDSEQLVRRAFIFDIAGNYSSRIPGRSIDDM
jgi:hypothetical protein